MNKFEFESLYQVIQRRTLSENKNSYSYTLYKNPRLLRKKILEEAKELVLTKNRKQVIWETSDLIYFILVFLVKRRVKLSQIKKKLMERNKNQKNLTKLTKEAK